MGVYLSSPITTKESCDQTLGNFTYGVSSMQGWRMSQEDAHNCTPDFDPETNTALFAVYDGHGGAEVAKYCSQYLPDFIKGVELYKEGKLGEGLQEAFLGFDATLTEEKVIQELKEIAGVDDEEEEDDDDEPAGRTETDMLVAEANMPIEELMAKYSSAGPPQTPQVKRLQKEKTSSPMLRAKKQSAIEKGKEGDANNSAEALATIVEDKLENGQPDNDNNLNVEKELREAESQSSDELNDNKEKLDKSESASDNTNNNEKSVKTDENGIKSDQDKKDKVENSSEVINRQKTVDADSTTDENHVANSEKVSSSSSAEVSTTSDPIQSSSLSSSSSSAEAGVSGSSAAAVDSKPSGSGCSSSAEPSGSSSAGPSGSSSAPSSSSAGPSGSSSAGPSGSGVQAGGCSSSSSKNQKTIVDEEFDSEDDSSEEEEYMEESDDEDDDDDDEDDEEEEGALGGVFRGKVFSSEEEEDHNEEPGSDSGCTAVVALMRDNHLVVANAGDSRCVLCRDGKAMDLSVDHKPEDDCEKTRIEEAGGKVTSDGRVNGGLNLSRALGDHWYKRNDKKPAKDQMISAYPDVEEATLSDKDEFMVIACDGIWNFMTSQEVVDFVKDKLKDPAKQKKPSLICEEMFDHCLAPNTMGDGTGCDNMTCIIVVFNQSQATKKRDTSELDTSASDEKQPEKRARLETEEKEPTKEEEKEASAEEAATT